MTASQQGWTDEQVERTIGNLLRFGVVTAAVVVLLGGLVYLIHHGAEVADHRVFHGEPQDLCTLPGIVEAAAAFRGRGLIQLGLVLLIATPVARVVFSVYAFARQRDWTYVVITLVVLAVLVCSLQGGGVEGGR
jgi:uncharacterized membrane protein